jgi:hypothetical protein
MFTHTKRTLILASSLILLFASVCFAAPKATLGSIKGDVQLRTGKEEPVKVTKSGPVAPGTTILCGADGSAVLHWKDGYDAAVQLSPLTVFTVRAPGDVKDAAPLEIEKGRVMVRASKVSKNHAEFAIKTPTAVTGIRGTLFTIDVDDNRNSAVAVIDGEVFLAAESVEKLIDTGFMSTVTAGEPPTEPVKIPEKQLDQLKKDSKALTEAPKGEGNTDQSTTDAVDTVEKILDVPTMPPAVDDPCANGQCY